MDEYKNGLPAGRNGQLVMARDWITLLGPQGGAKPPKGCAFWLGVWRHR
ncbi:MAG: hypothetical protein LBD31_01550 [Treponema sp.]|nr:hypothetical protein [Treponema sp.]